MKKKIAIMLLAVMTMSMVACGKQNNTNDNVNTETGVEENTNVENEAETNVDGGAGAEENAGGAATADGVLGILEGAWPSFMEEMKPVFGGEADGYFGYTAYEMTTAEEMDSFLGFPAAQFDKVDSVAYGMHQMNANNFTGAFYQLKNADDAQAVADALKDNIVNREWICGFPEKLIVVSVDDCVVAAFGNTQVIDGFKTSLTSTYENATLLYDESL